MYISIDLGGTKTRVAGSVDLPKITSVEKFSTAPTLQEQHDNIRESIIRISDGQELDAISLGIPGIVDNNERVFKKVPNYSILEGHAIEILIPTEYRHVPVYVANDAALAGYAEAISGAGQDYDSVAYITLSTGVGGVKIENKISSISQDVYEPGHHIINMDSDYTDNAGVKGSMEAYLSGLAFEKIHNCKPEDCTDHRIWAEYGKILAVGLENITALWSPDIIILGGSITNKFDLFFPSVIDSLEEFTAFKIPPIVKSVHGDNAGLIGGFEYIRQNKY